MKTKKTNREIVDFINLAAVWLNKKDVKETKFIYALKKVNKRMMRLFEIYQEGIEDINVKHCAVDGDGVIKRDDRGQYKFTRDGMQNRNDEIRKLSKESVEIEPYYSNEVPLDLDEVDAETLEGFVIQPEAKVKVAA